MILVYIDGIIGDCQIKNFEKYFTAESFSFGVERELSDSAKGGTADVNIGVGELQECTISKSMDMASPWLAKKAISGSSCGKSKIKFMEAVEIKNKRHNVVYLVFNLDNTFIKSWSMSGDGDDRPTEDVALWYNKIAFSYFYTTDGKQFKFAGTCAWDQSESKPWDNSGIETDAEMHATE